jgi:hypothetical protein
MLGMKAYSREYIEACRARADADLRAYRKQVGKAPNAEFEHRFFNDQVLLLDHMFVHRLTGAEGKDGNPLNEVRVLVNSLLYNDGKVQIAKLPGWPNSAGGAMKLPADKSVLGLEQGDAIRLSEKDFVRLADAFFTEIEKRYGNA